MTSRLSARAKAAAPLRQTWRKAARTESNVARNRAIAALNATLDSVVSDSSKRARVRARHGVLRRLQNDSQNRPIRLAAQAQRPALVWREDPSGRYREMRQEMSLAEAPPVKE
jgi:hypothetical protein